MDNEKLRIRYMTDEELMIYLISTHDKRTNQKD